MFSTWLRLGSSCSPCFVLLVPLIQNVYFPFKNSFHSRRAREKGEEMRQGAMSTGEDLKERMSQGTQAARDNIASGTNQAREKASQGFDKASDTVAPQ